MKASASIKFLHYSPKKLRELGKAIVGLAPSDAIDRLSVLSNKGARLLVSAVKSAVSNHTNNLKQDKSSLRIRAIEILKGPNSKRWQPVSRGMAHQIKKRTTHIIVKLEEAKKSLPEKQEERSKNGTKD